MLLSFGSHHMIARVDHTLGLVCMLIGLCIGGQERQKLPPSIEIDAYWIEGGPIYLNAMVGFYLNESLVVADACQSSNHKCI